MLRLFTAALGVVLAVFPLPALADDWMADKLRGQVMQLIDDQWQPLRRGMVVPDTRVIRTMKTGHVTLLRGSETVDLGPDTQIQIYDKAGRKPFTTVKQDFGTVSVEADVRQVQHFGVDTPFLAAVVKGTRFTVTSGKSGSSVSVRRGHVAVENLHTHSTVTLSVGQTATVGPARADETQVGGSGKLPTVVDSSGEPVATTTDDGTQLSVAGGLLTAGGGKGGISVGVGGVARVDVGGGGGLVDVGVGGSSSAGSDTGSGGTGQGDLLNLNIGGIHLGL